MDQLSVILIKCLKASTQVVIESLGIHQAYSFEKRLQPAGPVQVMNSSNSSCKFLQEVNSVKHTFY